MKAFTGVGEIRRVVTAERSNGASYIAADGPPGAVSGPGAAIWASDFGKTTLPIRGPSDDPTLALTNMFGAPGDTRFVAYWHPPHSNPSTHDLKGLRPVGANKGDGWHATYSYDYLIVMQGEIWLKTDEGEVLIKAGDIVVQGGVNHAWENKSDQPCLMYIVIVGVPEEKQD